MYSLVSICKKCNRRVLDIQLSQSSTNNCVHCYVEELKLKLDRECADHVITKQERQDLYFAFQILERNYNDLLELYDAAIQDNHKKEIEIHHLKYNNLHS